MRLFDAALARDPWAFDHVQTLVHEAGHAAYARHTGHVVTSETITLHPEGRIDHRGLVEWNFTPETTPTQRVVDSLIGPAAETLWLQTMHARHGTSTAGANVVNAGDMAPVHEHLAASTFRGDLEQAWLASARVARDIWDVIEAGIGRIDATCTCLTPRRTANPAPAAPAPTPETTTGGSMSVDELRAGVAEATQRGEASSAQLAQIHEELTGAAALLQQIAQGSGDTDLQQAVQGLMQVADQTQASAAAVQQAIQQAMSWTGRL